jgi:hypothetical protein
MGEYVLPHRIVGEQQRLLRMSSLLDPLELACLARLGVRRGWRCLELGCGNLSISKALAERVAPTNIDPHYWTRVITFIANWGRKPNV